MKQISRATMLMLAQDGWAVFVNPQGFEGWMVKRGFKRRRVSFSDVSRLVAEKKLVKCGEDKFRASTTRVAP